jgi:hypothetical protein
VLSNRFIEQRSCFILKNQTFSHSKAFSILNSQTSLLVVEFLLRYSIEVLFRVIGIFRAFRGSSFFVLFVFVFDIFFCYFFFGF